MRRWQRPNLRFTSWLIGILIGLAVVTGSRRLKAQDFLEPTTPAPPAPEGIEQAVVAKYWQLGRPRGFLAWTLEAGYAYVKPKFAAGYGQPYWSFVGVDAHPLISISQAGSYFGLSAALPGLTFRFGARYVYPFKSTFLIPRDSYTQLDTSLDEGPRADYLAWEAELGVTRPLWAGSVFGVVTGYRVELAAQDFFLYEESLRVVIKPPYVWRARLGYLLSLGAKGAIRVGPTAEVVGLPQRKDYVVRGGVVASVAINAHLEAQASLIPVLSSPDNLGRKGGDFGQLGVRFRWATQSTPDPARVRAFRLSRKSETPDS